MLLSTTRTIRPVVEVEEYYSFETERIVTSKESRQCDERFRPPGATDYENEKNDDELIDHNAVRQH